MDRKKFIKVLCIDFLIALVCVWGFLLYFYIPVSYTHLDVYKRQFVNSLPQEIYKDIEQTLLDVTWQYLTQPAFYEFFCRSQIRLFLYTLLSYLPYRVLTEEQSQIQKNQNARLDVYKRQYRSRGSDLRRTICGQRQ